jgi:outer membrane biosynthesis protein TonB
VLNTNSVVKRSGFDTMNRIETLEDQMKVLQGQLLAGAVQAGGDESSDPPSDLDNEDDDDPPPQQTKKPLKTDPNKRPDPDPIPERPEPNPIPEGKRENFLSSEGTNY